MSGVYSGRLRWCAGAALIAWCAAVPRAAAAEEAPAVSDTPLVPTTEPPLPCLSAAASDHNDPTRLLDLALSCYEAEEYDASLALLERLRTIDPNPVVLFNLGAAHAALGHCAEARRHYEQYLDQTQSESGKADAREQLQTLSDCQGAAAAAERPTEGTPSSSAPAEREAARPAVMVLRPPQPVSEGAPYAGFEAAPEPPSRLASWILLGSGAALLAASGGFAYASERAEQAEAKNGESGEDVVRSREDGQRYNTLAWACAGGALALATSGLLLIAFEPGPDVAAARSKPLTAGAWSLRLQHQF